MATFITPTTKLQAINAMLRTIPEAPINTLDGPQVADVQVAIDHLDATLLEVLQEGWDFNTEIEFPLTPNGSGEIEVPANCLRVVIDRRRYWDMELVQRGNRLYDRRDHTYIFTETLYAEKLTVALDFEQLPQAARWYITVRAGRAFQDVTVGDEAMHRFSEDDELRARVTMSAEHSDTGQFNVLRGKNYNLLSTTEVGRILAR